METRRALANFSLLTSHFPISHYHGRMSAREELEAIARFLETGVLPATEEKGLRYRLRIAVGMLGILAREAAAGARAEQSVEPGTADDRGALISAIRGADVGSPEWESLLERVRADLVAELAVTNPGFDPAPDIEIPGAAP